MFFINCATTFQPSFRILCSSVRGPSLGKRLGTTSRDAHKVGQNEVEGKAGNKTVCEKTISPKEGFDRAPELGDDQSDDNTHRSTPMVRALCKQPEDIGQVAAWSQGQSLTRS